VGGIFLPSLILYTWYSKNLKMLKQLSGYAMSQSQYVLKRRSNPSTIVDPASRAWFRMPLLRLSLHHLLALGPGEWASTCQVNWIQSPVIHQPLHIFKIISKCYSIFIIIDNMSNISSKCNKSFYSITYIYSDQWTKSPLS